MPVAPTPGAAPLIPDLNNNTQTGTMATINTPSGPATFEIVNYFGLPVEIREAFFRTDTGVPGLFGISTTGIPAGVIEQFRNLVQTGLIRPTNEAADSFTTAQGGFMPGQSVTIGGVDFGSLIGGLPGGFGIEWWQQAFNKATADAQQALADAVARGYFGDTPPRIDPATGQFDLNDPNLTLQARNTIAGIINQSTQTSIAKQLADASVRQKDEDLARLERERQDAVRAGDEQRAIEIGKAIGYLNGQATLEREMLEYERAANPARAFENELARGRSGAPLLQPGAMGVPGAQPQPQMAQAAALAPPPGPPPGAPGIAPTSGNETQMPTLGGPPGTPRPGDPSLIGQPYGAPTAPGSSPFAGQLMQSPAVVEAFRQGEYTPTAGQFGVESVYRPFESAGLGVQDFQQQNLKQSTKMTPTQQMIVGSYGRAGGVRDDEQEFYKQAGLAKTQGGGVQGSYQF